MCRHNNGHVTKIQASQCLHTLALTDDPEEIRVTNHNSSFLSLSLFYEEKKNAKNKANVHQPRGMTIIARMRALTRAMHLKAMLSV